MLLFDPVLLAIKAGRFGWICCLQNACHSRRSDTSPTHLKTEWERRMRKWEEIYRLKLTKTRLKAQPHVMVINDRITIHLDYFKHVHIWPSVHLSMNTHWQFVPFLCLGRVFQWQRDKLQPLHSLIILQLLYYRNLSPIHWQYMTADLELQIWDFVPNLDQRLRYIGWPT